MELLDFGRNKCKAESDCHALAQKKGWFKDSNYADGVL